MEYSDDEEFDDPMDYYGEKLNYCESTWEIKLKINIR